MRTRDITAAADKLSTTKSPPPSGPRIDARRNSIASACACTAAAARPIHNEHRIMG